MEFLVLVLATLIPALIFSLHRLLHQYSTKLPPGSLGWPYIGETFQLYSQNPNVFFAKKQQKYGSIYKTHVLGCPCVLISNPEAVRHVLVSNANLFKPTFPASKERMLGKQAIFFHQGDYHFKLRKLVLRAFAPESINGFIPDIDLIARRTLQSLVHERQEDTINTFQEMKTYTFNVALLSIFGRDEFEYSDDLKRCYYTLEKGYNSMPINIPGTLFHKAMKARKEIADIVGKTISARRRTMMKKRNIDDDDDHTITTTTSDLLSSFMSSGDGLSDEQITDNVIGVIFAARDTTASVLTWILKFLAENPTVLHAVVEEQEAIMNNYQAQGKNNNSTTTSSNIGLTWAYTKKMPVTTRVIQETMRVASILSFTFREAVQDVQIQGYLIPKGWKVMPLFRNIHHSSDHFCNPEKFDPSRFQVAPKPNTFLPFGNGIHSCPGNELAKLEILILLHHLTTKYRWTVVGPQNGIQYGPFALPQNGLPIHLHPKHQEDSKRLLVLTSLCS